jgi:4-hydroxy-tetrahydrodipicolinate synthase
MKAFRGLFPPIITTFDSDGKFCEKSFRDHIDFLIENDVDGMCIATSTGEFMNLTPEEHEKVLRVGIEHVNGRVPVIAGGAALSTRASVELSQFAESLGYNGLLIISPWYQVHTQREIYAHFKAISSAVSIPIMIYNNAPVTGLQLSYDLLVRMAEEGIIQYLKDAESDPFMLSRLRARLGDKIGLFYGHDNNAIGAFAAGAVGWVSGAANFDPKRWAKLTHLCIDDCNFKDARKLWYEMMPFMQMVTVGRNGERPDWIAVIKRALELRGRKVGTVRPPMLPVTQEVDAELIKIVKSTKF